MVDKSAEHFERARARFKDPVPCTDVPNAYWITLSGLDSPTQTYIASSVGGTLWICYEYSGTDTPPTLTLWEQGGSTQDVPTGQSTFTVDAWFMLYYDIGTSGTSVKLGYALS